MNDIHMKEIPTYLNLWTHFEIFLAYRVAIPIREAAFHFPSK